MPKVSVIIPIYGVEKYIERCARSLFEQTLDDIEYIFVNDCTLDKSIDILKKTLLEYPSRVNQTTIVKTPTNGGLPGARKYGLQFAKGEYIIHCDSDDWVSTDMYNEMYKKAVEDVADLVVCDYITADGIEDKRYSGLGSTDKKQTILNMFFGKNLCFLWNKLLKREIYENEFTYPQDNMCEDMALMMQLLIYCSKLSYVPQPFYYYRDNPLSISKIVSLESIVDRFIQTSRNISIVESFYKKHLFDKEIREGLLYWKFLIQNTLLPVLDDKKYYKLWLYTFPEINFSVFLCSKISIKEKMKFLMTLCRLYPGFFCLAKQTIVKAIRK